METQFYPVVGTEVGFDLPVNAGHLPRLVAMIWAFHLQHNAPINLDFHTFIQRTNMPHPRPIVGITSLTPAADINATSPLPQSITATLST